MYLRIANTIKIPITTVRIIIVKGSYVHLIQDSRSAEEMPPNAEQAGGPSIPSHVLVVFRQNLCILGKIGYINWFSSSVRETKCFKFAIEFGIKPIKLLPLKLSTSKCSTFPMAFGIVLPRGMFGKIIWCIKPL